MNRMTRVDRNIFWYDRLQLALEACQQHALSCGDVPRARRIVLLRLWAYDRAELLARDA